MFTGLLLIAAALLLQGYNLWDQARADRLAAEQLRALKLAMADRDTENLPFDPDMEMPTVTIDGYEYIGTLEIPCIGISLPVMSQWSYSRLKVAPCRYAGSLYRGDMIIAAHNYKRHFGLLKTVPPGETVIFTDVDGRVFSYAVADMEILPGTAVAEMESGEWDLTLFTCTKGGRTRITLRCNVVAQTDEQW